MAQEMMNYSKNISHGSRHDELHELYFSIQGLVVLVFNATFNIISVVSWSVLLVVIQSKNTYLSSHGLSLSVPAGYSHQSDTVLLILTVSGM
jgi:hypothetical protein